MLNVERIGEIYNLLQKKGAVRVDELAERFGVSEMTIRRDLEKMEKENKLVRCHGGAMPRTEMTFDQEFDKKTSVHMEPKIKIAQYCFEHYVKENMVVYLDTGSTVLELAKMLVKLENLTVVTNDVTIAGSLINSHIQVFVLGGCVQNKLGCVHGHIAEKQLENYRMDVAFVSSLCADDFFDVFAATESKVYLRKKLMSCARQTYMLMDESKFQRQSLFRINNLAEYSAVITNKVLSEEMAFRAAQTGVEWITVDTAEPQN